MSKRYKATYLILAVLVALSMACELSGEAPQPHPEPRKAPQAVIDEPTVESAPPPEPVEAPTPPDPVMVTIPPGIDVENATERVVMRVLTDTVEAQQLDGGFALVVDGRGIAVPAVPSDGMPELTGTPMPMSTAIEHVLEDGLNDWEAVWVIGGMSNAEAEMLQVFIEAEVLRDALVVKIPLPPGVPMCDRPRDLVCPAYPFPTVVSPRGDMEIVEWNSGSWDIRIKVEIIELLDISNTDRAIYGIVSKSKWISIRFVREMAEAVIFHRILKDLLQNRKSPYSSARYATVPVTVEVRDVTVVTAVLVLIIVATGPTPDDLLWLGIIAAEVAR